MEKKIKAIKFSVSNIVDSFSYFMNFTTVYSNSKDQDLKKLSSDMNNVGLDMRRALDGYKTSTSKGDSKTR